jgi:TonB family protein
VNTHAEAANDGSGKEEGQDLVPFPTWSMNAMPSGFTVFGHQIKTALPVFTPDPPILHGEVPEFDRGKEVVLEVVIDDQGSIAQVEVLQAVGHGVEDSIMQTLRRWIFVPAKVNGVGIASRRQLRFHFPS